jgi:predicted transposase YdaD
MRESATYQAILREGRTEGRTAGRLAEARSLLLRQGARKFGTPTRAERGRLSATRSLERLESLAERLLDVQSWEELLAS